MNLQLPNNFSRAIQFILLIFLFSLQGIAKEPSLVQLDAVLKDLRDYEYGEPETWKPELIETMRLIYQEPKVQGEAESLLKRFLKSDLSPSARQAVLNVYSKLASGDTPLLQTAMPEAGGEVQSRETIRALGKQGTVEASLKLIPLLNTTPGVEEALLECSERLARKSLLQEANAIYKHLYLSSENTQVRVAALRGQFHLAANPEAFLIESIQAVKPPLRPHVIRLAKLLPGDYQNGIKLLKLGGLGKDDQIQLLKILAARHDPSIYPVVVDFLRSEDPRLRNTALEVLPSVGRSESIELLLPLTVGEDTEEQSLARQALYRIPGAELDQKLARLLDSQSPPEQIELIKAIAERNSATTTPSLLNLAVSEHPGVRSEALDALGKIAPVASLDALIDLLQNADSAKAKKDLEKTLTRIALRHVQNPASARILRNRIQQTDDRRVKESLQTILQKLAESNS